MQRPRLAEKPPGLVQGVAEGGEPQVEPDEIEEIAIFSRRRSVHLPAAPLPLVGPFRRT